MKIITKKILVVSSVLLLFCITFNTETNYRDLNVNLDQNENSNDIYDELFSSLSSNASTTYQVSSSLDLAITPRVATDRDKNVHAVWMDRIDGTKDILYRKFSYATQTWGTITNLSDYSSYGEGDQESPTIAIDEFNNIWVAWIDKYPTSNLIAGRYYNNSLSSWGPRTLIRNSQTDYDNFPPQIVNSTGGNFTIVYTRLYQGIWSKIYFQHYDRINGWGATYSVISPSVLDDNPSVYFDSENKGHLTFRRQQNLINSIMYCNLTVDPADGIKKFGIDATGQQAKILNVTQNLRHAFYTYAADRPDIISVPSTNQIYITWQDNWNSSGNSQIRLVNLTRTSYVENSILHNKITNLTIDMASNRYWPKIGLGFNSTNPSLIWNDGGAQGKVILKKTLTSAEMEFDHDSNNILTANSISELAFDKHNTLSVVYSARRSSAAEDKYQIWFRQYDVWGPQLTVNSPVNNTVTTGNVTLDVTTEIDTRTVKYEYFIDTDGNGLANEAGSWTLIRQMSSTTNQFDAEWNTTENGAIDHLNILIRTTAVDINGLDQVIIKGYIIVDNHVPQIVKLTHVWDNSGHYRSATSGGTYYFCNTTSFNYIVSDNCSGVDYVELFNGITSLGTNSSSGNNTAIILDTSNGLLDGTYSNLFIRAYDRTANVNTSVVMTPTIVIDNKKPTGLFVNLVENTEYSRTLGLNMTTIDSDTLSLVYYYYNSSDAPGVYHLIGSATFSSGAWRRSWATQGVWDGQYTIRAVITDLTGWVNVTEMDISIDNTAPTPALTSPSSGQEVGARVLVTVRSDLDTVQVVFYNCSSNPTQLSSWRIFNSSIYYTQDSQYRYFSVYFDAIVLPAGAHYLKALAIDNQNYMTNTSYLGVQITNKYPASVTLIQGSWEVDPSSNTYNVTISWTSPAQTWDVTSYAIFRIRDDPLFFSPQFIQIINALTPIQKFNYLGNVEGEKYFIKQYDVEEIDDLIPRVYEWTDSNLSASNYYYIIIAVNVYENPSNCSPTVTIRITPENPDRNVNFLEVEFLPYLALIYAGLLAALTVISVKSSKSKTMHKEARVKLESMYEEKFSKEGEKTFEQRMDEMETAAVTAVAEKAPIEVKEKVIEPVKKTKEDNFLEMKVTTEDVKTTEAEGPRRCPNCNWIISSKAFKCPRCGKAV